MNPIAYWKSDRLLRAVVYAALALHVLSALFAFFFHYSGISPLQDPLEYRTIALNVLQHGTFSIAPASANMPDLLRTPGYPLFLAATFLVDSRGLLAILLQQVLLVLCGVLVYGLLRYFSVSRIISLVLLVFYLLEPQQWFYSLQTMSEVLYTVVFLAAIAWLLLPKTPISWQRAAGIGVLLGASVLVKPSGVLVAPFLLLLFLARNDGALLQRFKMMCVAAALAAVVLIPWVVRNHALTGDWLLSSSGTYNFISGLDTTNQLGLHDLVIHPNGPDKGLFNIAYSTAGYAQIKQIEQQLIRQDGWFNIAERQLMCAPKVWFGQSLYMIASIGLGSFGAAHAGFFNWLGFAEQAVFLLLFVAGSACIFFEKKYRWLYAWLFCMVLVTTLITVCNSYSRMLIPLYPVIAIAAGVFFTQAASWLARLAKESGV